jgi:UDP-N-acetylglucosamine--N-acetylmuramyl-(pentapeptide) pyrophosphoryl-undecaprenol N-acetylglucosamine transferase
MKIIISGGGTAGHTHPALAIAEEIAAREKKENILFVLREGGAENKLIEKSGFKIKYLDVMGLKRSLSCKNITALKKALHARELCRRIIREFKPDIVLGTGGYVCWPLLSAASEMKIKTVIHESNIVPGLSAKMLSHRASLILTNFEESLEHFKNRRAVCVGNPLVSDFGTRVRDVCRKRIGIPRDDIFILSVGGSLGARKLNCVVCEAMEKLSAKYNNLSFIHSVGEKNIDQIKEFKTRKFKMLPYINGMADYLGAADIVISRCGAVTLSEIALSGVAAILVPSPNVTNNHQLKNAKAIYECGAAIMLTEDALSCDSLLFELNSLIMNKEKRNTLGEKIRAFAKPDARNLIYRALYDLTYKKQ